MDRRNFLRLGALAAAGVVTAACAPAGEKDPNELVRWTPVDSPEWKVEGVNFEAPADLVGGGCPCSIRVNAWQGRELDRGEAASLIRSRYYVGEISPGQVRDDIWSENNGHVAKASLWVQWIKDKDIGMFSPGGVLTVRRVVRQIGDQLTVPFMVDFNQETMVVASVIGTTKDKLISRQRLVIWQGQGQQVNAYMQPLGLQLVK